jgi:hypothetical protein
MKPTLKSLIISTAVLLTLCCCTLNRSVIPPAFPGVVRPNVVCPGETVTVAWDLSMLDADCVRDPRACERDPLSVDVTASGGMTFSVSPAPISGSQSGIATGPDDVTISVHAFDTNQDLGTRTETVNVLGPTEELNFPASCAGMCEGGIPAWAAMTVNFGRSILSSSIHIRRIRNTTSIPIILTVFDEGLVGRDINLAVGATTTPDFTTNIVRVAARPQPAFFTTFTLSADCRGGSVDPVTPPGPITLSVTYGCPG